MSDAEITQQRLAFRASMVERLRCDVVGPDSEYEIIDDPPSQRYLAGILYPQESRATEDIADEERLAPEDTDADTADDELSDEAPEPNVDRGRMPSYDDLDSEPDDPILLTNQFQPSAVGVSFALNGAAELEAEAQAATYQKVELDADGEGEERPRATAFRQWQRMPLELEPVTFTVEADSGEMRQTLTSGLEFRARVRQRLDDALIVTACLVNTRRRSGHFAKSEDAFYQVSLRIRGVRKQLVFCRYASPTPGAATDEEASLELVYRRRRAFAVGHGCAVDWSGVVDSRASEVVTQFIPSYELSSTTPRSEKRPTYSMEFMGKADLAAVVEALEQLPADYEFWRLQRKSEAETLSGELADAATRHIDLCLEVNERVREGIRFLRGHARAFKAFQLANLAMLMQQVHYRRPARALEDLWEPLPDEYEVVDRGGRVVGFWRAFQLAFILMNVGCATRDCPPSSWRRIVDLIWFPTGGGKTEAYLGLIAYAIFLRRLHDPGNTGCVAFMRYTLRLLTAQQFQRASTLICACESLRRANPEELGGVPISIGLWVGRSLSPNRREDAVRARNDLENDTFAKNPFQVLDCPWCGTHLDRRGKRAPLGYQVVTRPQKTVRFVCPESRCAFSSGDEALPISVIDEDLYDAPPALMIATIDKFAMLAWRPEARALFGLDGSRHSPPDLIIQDELHLLAGPLGSLAGLYEVVVELLSSWDGDLPKIVASTATIRGADVQTKCLYNREIREFPPPGLDIDDNFFAMRDAEAPARLYVGVHAPARSRVMTELRVAASLLHAACSIPLPEEAPQAVRDPYWTLVEYFGSLRELGLSATLALNEYVEQLRVINRRLRTPTEQLRYLNQVVELTSRRSADEIPKVLSQLERTCIDEDRRAVDLLLATNMISVGVDVDRLGLMLVMGQPRSTAEYIQATSRVGRSSRAPGLIVALFNPSRPRDKSHYERFREFHGSFYRFVEPSTVTPFSVPALERALHALLVIAVRQVDGVERPNALDSNSATLERLRELLLERVGRIAPEHVSLLDERLHKLVDVWLEGRAAEFGTLNPTQPEERPLMYPAGLNPQRDWTKDAWPVNTSMRHVDAECRASVLGRYPAASEDSRDT